MIFEHGHHPPGPVQVLMCGVFEPANRPARLAEGWFFGNTKSSRSGEVFVKPLSNQVVLFHFVGVKLSVVP